MRTRFIANTDSNFYLVQNNSFHKYFEVKRLLHTKYDTLVHTKN